MTPLDQNTYINQYNDINVDTSFNQYSFDLRSSKSIFSREFFDSGLYIKPRSVDLFIATFSNDVRGIENYLKIYNDGINDLDKEKRNALQSALYSNNLTIETCNALIQFGINLNQIDRVGNCALGHLVYFTPSSSKNKLALFRCIVEGGADLNVKYNFPLEKNVNIRERIRLNSELECIVQDVNAKRANHVYAALGGDFRVTELVCKILDLSPASNWRPSIN